MVRRTPLLALLLAPVVLIVVLLLWQAAIGPMLRSVWHGAAPVLWRLGSGAAGTREAALFQAVALRPARPELVARITEMARSDPVASVRVAALRALGQVGEREALPDAARQTLIDAVLGAQDGWMVEAALTAAGTSAAHNRYPAEVAQHAAHLLADPDTRVHPAAAAALGPLGAAQPLSPEVFDALNAVFVRPDRAGIREPLARAFAQIAEARPLPPATIDLLVAQLGGVRGDSVRALLIQALAHGAADHPPAQAAIAAALGDPNPNVQAAARNGMRIVETRQLIGSRAPVDVALDPTAPVAARLRAVELFQTNSADPASREQIATLAGDDDVQVAAAALGKLPEAGLAADDEFDRRRLIPVWRKAMTHRDAVVRVAAFRAASRLVGAVARRAEVFRDELEAGMVDTDADVRIAALGTLLRVAPNGAAADALLARALRDADPRVRQSAAGALAGDWTSHAGRQALLDEALRDPVESVRSAAAAAQAQWQAQRDAWWPRQLLQRLREGEFGQIGRSALSFVTIAAPIGVGVVFLVYFMARMLTYLFQRRWRALVVLPVVVAWIAASVGMFQLYFVAGHLRWVDPWSIVQGLAILWAAVALYAALGWGMHYLVRR